MYFAAAQIQPSHFPTQKPGQIKRINCKTTSEAFATAFPNEAITTVLKTLVTGPHFAEWDSYRNILAHRSAPGRNLFASVGQSSPDPAADWKIDWSGSVKIDVNLTPPRLSWLVAFLE
jgi:hypothetical protein